MADEPRSKLARYAYGFSDEKPGVWWVLFHVGLVAFVLYNMVTLQ